MKTQNEVTPKGQHTKGQWSFQTTHNKIEIFSFVNGIAETNILNSCLMNGEEISTREQIANAKLIASAPELLKACIWAKEQFKKLADEGRYPEFLLAQNGGDGIMPLVNAIKKATE